MKNKTIEAFQQIIRDLKNDNYAPIYLLEGDEGYYIDRITNYILDNALTEAEKGFNQTILYGKDATVDAIITAARRFPMMAARQVIVVREAQMLQRIEDLEAYVKNPLDSTILVLNYRYKSVDKRSAFSKAIKSKGLLFTSSKLYDNQIPDWISAYTRGHGYAIDMKSCQMLGEFIGNNLEKISNELEKLMIVCEKSRQITPNDIEKNIGVSKDFNIFELQDALGTQNILKANRIVNYFAQNQKQHPMLVSVMQLYGFFRKLWVYHFLEDKRNDNAVAGKLGVNPYFVKDYRQAAKVYPPRKLFVIFGLLREYDLKSKGLGGGSAAEGDLFRELIFKILH